MIVPVYWLIVWPPQLVLAMIPLPETNAVKVRGELEPKKMLLLA